MFIEVFLKSVGELQTKQKKDGSGMYTTRDIVLQVNDNSLYRDEFLIRLGGEKAESFNHEKGKLYSAEISFSVRTYEDKVYQELWLKNITPVDGLNKDNDPFL